MIQLKFQGLEKLNAKLRKAAAKCPQEKMRLLSMEGEILIGRTKMLTPVDTGNLRNSWQKEMSGDSVEVGNNVEYSPFVEFGHRVKIRGRYTGRVVEGVYMLRNAVDECEQNFNSDLQMMMSRIFN